MNRLPFLQVLEADFPFGLPRGYENSKPPNEIGFQPFLFSFNVWRAQVIKQNPLLLPPPETNSSPLKIHGWKTTSRWWFHIFFIFTPIWGRFPFWLIFFKGVEITN